MYICRIFVVLLPSFDQPDTKFNQDHTIYYNYESDMYCTKL